MTEKDIIKVLARRLDNRKYIYQIPNAFIYPWECDYWICDRHGNTREMEIKISRADYFADGKKQKHASQGANYFYYVCPKNLIQKHEVDKKYGLIYVLDDGYLVIEKKPQRLNNNKFDNWKQLAHKMYWRWYELWKAKYIGKEITHEQYIDAFAIETLTS